jgi:oligoendopeptidase F
MKQAELPPQEVDESLDLFDDTVHSFGGVLQTAYEFMEDYELWDTSQSPNKLPCSYMTYLNSYEMTFLYVSPTGTQSDLLTLCHEFGHFVDGFVNCGGFSSVDCAEIFSQGLEFLSLSRADLNPSQRTKLIRSKIADSVMVFLTQACYAEFEALAYSLPEEKLNAQGLNELFLECNNTYGLGSLYAGMESLLAPGWIDVQHFFIAPYYVVSYCLSNDAALQIYQRELAEGTGLELYYELLTLPTESSLLQFLEDGGLVSPFTPGRMEDLADFLDDQMN